MSLQERLQLKDRQRAIEEAEQSRRRAVTVSFDLLGRQVRGALGAVLICLMGHPVK